MSSSSGARCWARRSATFVLALAELAKPWPIALIVDHLIGDRTGPFDARHGPAGRDRRADPRHRGRRVRRDVLLQPLDAERRRAHHARAADRDLRPPAAAQPRLPPAHAQGRPAHARHRGRQRHGRAVLRHPRRDAPVRAAGGRDDDRAAVHRPRPGAVQPGHGAAAGRGQLRLPPQGPRARPHAAPPRGRPGQRGQRDARRDAGRQGLRRRGPRVRADPPQERAADGRRRRGRAAAGALRRHRRRAARVRHRARDRLRRDPRQQGRAERRRPDHLRQLHAQGVEPDALLRPRGGQADRRAGARRPHRRDPRDRRGARGRHVPRPARPRRDRAARTSPSPTPASAPRSTASTSSSPPASGSRSRARPAPANRPSPRSSPASTTRRRVA